MEDEVDLLGVQLMHMVDMMDAKLDRIELNQEHLKELIEHRLNYLEKQGEDHESMIRAATEGVTQFKVRSGLTSVGSGLLSILAMAKTFLGIEERLLHPGRTPGFAMTLTISGRRNGRVRR